MELLKVQGEIMKVWNTEMLIEVVRSCVFGIYLEEELTGHTDG